MPPRLTGVQPLMERRSAPGRGVSRMQAGGRFAPVGAAFRGYLRGQSLCGLWNDPVCLTVFSRRAAPGGSRFAASRTLRPPFSRLTGRVCARMGEERFTPWQRPFGGAERRERAAGGVWRAFQRECLHILSRPAPVKCTSACNGGQKSAERAAGLHLWPRGRIAFRRPSHAGTAVHWLCRPTRQPSGWGAGAGPGRACWRTVRAARPCGSVPLLKGAHGISRPAYASLPRLIGCPAPVPSRGEKSQTPPLRGLKRALRFAPPRGI